ncbi:MAG: LamG domain-containing protein [Planctomycetota bacterium]
MKTGMIWGVITMLMVILVAVMMARPGMRPRPRKPAVQWVRPQSNNSTVQTIRIESNKPKPPAGLVGWWKFDEASGITATDSSKNGNDGTISGGAIWSDGALAFDGVDDLVKVPHSPSFDIAGQLTIEAWVNLQADHSSMDNTMIRKNGSFLLELGESGINVPIFYICWEDKSTSEINGPPIPKFEWHHLAATYDGNAMRLYMDGNLVSYDSVGKRIMRVTAEPLTIGRWEWNKEWYKGLLGDVQIYNYARTQDQIKEDSKLYYTPGTEVRWETAVTPPPEQATREIPAVIRPERTPKEELTPELQAKIARLIEQLGDERFENRQAAQNELIGLGDITIPELEKALQNPDAQIKMSAQAILKSLRPVGWWKLDETSGITATDSSKNGNDGTVHGNPAWDGGLSCDGEDDYVEVPGSRTWNITDQLTIEAWVNLQADHPSGQCTMIRKSENFLLELGDEGTNRPVFLIYRVDGSSFDYDCINGPAIPKFEWHHLAATYDGNAMRMYIDGNLVSSESVGKRTISVTNAPLTIGRRIWNDEWFKGIISDVKIYDCARTADQIKADSRSR